MTSRRELSRRTFLDQSGRLLAAAGATAALTQNASAAEESKPAPHGLKKAVKYSMVRTEGSIEEKFQLLKDIGFDGIDINVRLDHDEVNKAQEKTGLKVHGVVGYDHWSMPLSDPDPKVRAAGLESFKGAMRDCAAYGGTSALLVPGKCTKEVAYADAYQRSQEEIGKLLDLAEELKVDILIENVWNDYLFSPVEMARFVDDFNSPRMGVYFDVGNIVRYGWPAHWVRALGPRIRKLDIKEYSRKLQHSKGPRSGFGVKIGEGDVDWPEVMQALKDIGFKGWATAEVGGGDAARLKDIHDRMEKVFTTPAG
ncbi:MAG: sugar phosphate isomerase/epimerase [Planctomycetaceae bacterium]|nr:sugar phosphate isomerase/epimerase [Planctomycetaceae bacterium]